MPTKVNIRKLVDNIRRANVYQPIIEAIVNSIDAIDEVNKGDGEIRITLTRDAQLTLLREENRELPPFVSVEISDNGIGFVDQNMDAFNTIYTEAKIRRGGKGFGRFFYLKYFSEVSIESTYSEQGKYYYRNFQFVKDNDIIKNEVRTESELKERRTVVTLNGLRREQSSHLDKTVETIARKLLEKLLVYFAMDDYKCPRIIVGERGGATVVLNDLIGSGRDISEVKNATFALENENKKEEFKIKIFKIFFGETRSAVCLTADHRQVTDVPLHDYIPEFRGEFYEESENGKGEVTTRNYTLRAYVMGAYLDRHVSDERDGFNFQYTSDLFYDFSQREIEEQATTVVRQEFGSELSKRYDKKMQDIRSYVDEKAPWHKGYLKDLDLSSVPFGASDGELESSLQKLKFQKEQTTRAQIEQVMARDEPTEISEQVEQLICQISEIGRSELVHYIALRKIVLEVFKKSLTWGADKKYEKEKVIHEIIYPQRTDSEQTPYEGHNLWLLDERLSYTEYVASDLPLQDNTRPDLLIFDKKVLVRGENTPSNPIVVFEFKRPARDGYDEDENPLKQITEYVRKVRNHEVLTPLGRPLEVNDATPAYGYLVCDITPKIEGFCADFQMIRSPDGLGYFGYHTVHRVYLEVISFDKLVKDSELRNKILFKKMGLE